MWSSVPTQVRPNQGGTTLAMDSDSEDAYFSEGDSEYETVPADDDRSKRAQADFTVSAARLEKVSLNQSHTETTPHR